MNPPRITVDAAAELAPWRQVHDQLTALVDAGALAPGQRLPAIRRLARDLAVAPGTVARAYRELEGRGRVRTARGGGTTVVGPGPDPFPVALLRLARRFLADAAAVGADPATALDAVRDVVRSSPEAHPHRLRKGERMHRAAGAVLLALATAACWWAWLAWDRSYQVDPATGTTSGPYEAWQVIGCVLSLVTVTAVAATRLPLWIVVPVGPVAFTVAWSLTAAGADGTGANLWPVGAALVLAGTLGGAALVAVPTAFVSRRRA